MYLLSRGFRLDGGRLARRSKPGVVAWSVAGCRTPGPSCFRQSALARHAAVGRFIRREFCEEACEKGPFRAPDAALSSAVSVVALIAFCLTSGTKGVKLPAYVHPLRARRACGTARGYGVVPVVRSWPIAAVWVLLSSFFG